MVRGERRQEEVHKVTGCDGETAGCAVERVVGDNRDEWVGEEGCNSWYGMPRGPLRHPEVVCRVAAGVTVRKRRLVVGQSRRCGWRVEMGTADSTAAGGHRPGVLGGRRCSQRRLIVCRAGWG